MNTIDFKSLDGTRLKGIWHIPTNTTTKAVILAHGITANKDESGIFKDLAEKLKENDVSVFRFDFRGHGESEGKSIDTTITGELEDLTAAYDEVIQAGYKNVGLLGASFGGSIATFFIEKYPSKCTSLCLWNPVINYDHTFINPITTWIRERKEQLKKEVEEKGWTAIGSHGFVVGRALFKEMEGMFPYEAMKHITLPTIIIHGDADTHVPYSDSAEYFPNLKGDTKFVTIKGAEHGFHDSKEHSEQAITSTLQFFKKYL